MKRTPLQSARRHRMWAFSHSSRLRRQTAVRSRPRWGQRACRWSSWDGFWQFVQKFFVYANRLLQQLSRWRLSDNLEGEDAGCGGPGLVWGWLDVLPNSLKCLWRRLMVEKLTFNSRATALVDIHTVGMPIARSLKTCDICGIVLCDKTAHFREAFYCGQPETPHLCNYHAVSSASWNATPVRWMDYLSKGEVLTNTDLDRFVNNIWEK